MELRQTTIASIKDGKMPRDKYEQYRQEAYATIDRFLITTANRISALFQQVTGRKCHVSIKLFEIEKIRTVTRDDGAFANRREIDEHMNWYPYKDNTAFERILDDPQVKVFVSNHLLLQNLLGNYKNTNPKWKSLYSACMVVPITKKTHSAEINKDSVLGFLCVDNRSGGFEQKIGLNLLQSFARMYEFVFIASAALRTELDTRYR
jgi:hypothetical protein